MLFDTVYARKLVARHLHQQGLAVRLRDSKNTVAGLHAWVLDVCRRGFLGAVLDRGRGTSSEVGKAWISSICSDSENACHLRLCVCKDKKNLQPLA